MNGEESRSERTQDPKETEIESPEMEERTDSPEAPVEEPEPELDPVADEELQDEDLEDEEPEVPFEATVEEIEDRPGWQLVSVTIPQEEVDQRLGKAFDELRREAAIPGFRPGKAPVSVIRMRLGKAIRAELAQEMILGTLERAIEDLGFKTTGAPEMDPPELEEKQPFQYSIRVETLPEVVLGTYRGLEATKTKPVVTQEMVTQQLETLRERKAEFSVAEDRPAEQGDFLVVTLGAQDAVTGEALFEPSDSEVTVGSGETLPNTGFEEALVGLTTGESKTVPIEFPEEYQLAAFAGKHIEFKVTIKEIKRRTIPELNDEFAKEMGLDSLEELEEMTRDRLEAAQERQADEALKRSLLDALVDASPFEPPESMIRRRAERLVGGDLGKLEEEMQERFITMSGRTVKQELLLEKIAEVEGIEVDEDQVDQAVARAALQERISKEELLNKWDESGQLEGTRARILEEQVVEFLTEVAQITEEEAPAPDDSAAEGDSDAPEEE